MKHREHQMGRLIGKMVVLAVLAWTGVYAKAILYSGGDIITMQGERPHYVEALAEVNGTIMLTGKLDEVRKRYPNAKAVDLNGSTLMPGFFDPHGHLFLTTLSVAYLDLSAPPIGKVDSIAKLQQVLRSYIKTRHPKPGEWIIGMNYDDTLLKEKRHPTRQELDAVSTANPIFLLHISSHLAAVNSKAIAEAGLSDSSKDPKGGRFRRDAQGRLSGVVEEGAAMMPFMQKIPQPSAEVAREYLQKTLKEKFVKEGITTVQEAGTLTPPLWKLLQSMADAEVLPVDVICYPSADFSGMLKEYDQDKTYHNRLRMGGLKIILDGSIQGYTAYLSKPYFSLPKSLKPEPSRCRAGVAGDLFLDTNGTHVHTHQKPSGYVGKPNYTQKELDTLVAKALQHRWHLLVHCNGDAAVQMYLDAMQKALVASPQTDHRSTIIHAQVISETQLDRVKAMGMYLSMFPGHIYYWGDRHAKLFLGPRRAQRLDPMQSALKRGINLTLHADAPVTPTRILDVVQFAVDRTTTGGEELGKSQEISVYDALKAVTINAARQHFEEKEKGTLEAGKVADMVILSQNPLKVDKKHIRNIRVLETIKAGKTIYRASE